MEVNNIDDLIKLAGLVNSQAPTATAESEVEEADCGCSDEQPAAVMTNSPDMYAILKRCHKWAKYTKKNQLLNGQIHQLMN
jgi:hypothetical protein